MKYLLLLFFFIYSPLLMWAEESDQVPSSDPAEIIKKPFIQES